MIPEKLKKGSHIRVIAPAQSMGVIQTDMKSIALNRLTDLGLRVTFGKHVGESDDFSSTTIKARSEDLHEAFSDKSVDGILTVIGGWNSNQLLDYIDWDLIRKNPKIFCGFSDITVLNNSIFARTGLATYSGPHFSTFGQQLNFEYTLDYFLKCLFSDEPFEIKPSKEWSNDKWWENQLVSMQIPSEGWIPISEGEAEGIIIGANLCSFNLLQGTEYFPELSGSVLFLEDDWESQPHTFDRDLQSLIHLPSFKGVKGIVIGRFEKDSNMTTDLLQQIIRSKKELNNIPVIADVDFGHCDPKITFPVGGIAYIKASGKKCAISIKRH
ncbi:MAG: LD-carboxypeptidase [Planctomycetes bacterium]|nr:LD-carboxypeptidase [Planctomycetota bacterium]